MKTIAAELPVAPLSVIVFGSFARGEADDKSDTDTVLIRPEGIDESDDDWSGSVGQWRDTVARVSGNRVEVLEVSAADIAGRLRSQRQVWKDVSRWARRLRARSRAARRIWRWLERKGPDR
ncbi:MAG: nucleotidyltransferase domain-containing protein [Actinobacteria bacterium]|nr:nucleotidyltransferase domain-containing protein [Actinomycetota bacterium]